MDTSYDHPEYNTYGVQTFTAGSANLSLSGFEEYSGLADPTFDEAASFSGHSYHSTYTTSDMIASLSGHSTALHHNLPSGALTSPHGTSIHLSVSVVTFSCSAMIVAQLKVTRQ